MMIRGQAVNQGPLPRNMHSVCAQMKHMHITCTVLCTLCSNETDTPWFDPDSMQSNSLCIGADNICHILPGRGNSVLNHMSADHVTYKVLQATLLISHSITKQKPHISCINVYCLYMLYVIRYTVIASTSLYWEKKQCQGTIVIANNCNHRWIFSFCNSVLHCHRHWY